MRSLGSADREFLDLVNRAVFSNPFSLERDAADRAIAPDHASGSGGLIAAVEERVAGCLDSILGGGVLVHAFEEDDQERLEHALLFRVFHACALDLDRLIQEQRGHTKSLRFAAGPSILAALTAHGMTEARAQRALELFFQMRRAFFFLSTELAGDAPSMRRLRAALWDHIFTRDVLRYERFLWNRMEDFSTLIEGETGSGKGAAAAALGRSGFIAWDGARGRFEAAMDSLFVSVNLSEFSASLVESELFGHRKGAFTGAIDTHVGLFGRCPPHGVIFLDEIAEVSPGLQVKLLRVLQERLFTPVGDRVPQRFEGRVVAATHASLETLRQEGSFRDDLFYRLCSDRILVPSLRQRLAEDPAEVGAPAEELAADVLRVLARDIPPGYGWFGNVRELEQSVRRVLLTGSAAPIGGAPTGPQGADGPAWLGRAARGSLDAKELLAGYCAMLHEQLGTYEEVARVTGLDRRTVKKHVQAARP